MNNIDVVVQSKVCHQDTFLEFKVGDTVKTLTDNSTGHTYVRTSKSIEIIEQSIPEPDRLAETIINTVNFQTDRVFGAPATQNNYFVYAEKTIDVFQKVLFKKGEYIPFFRIEERSQTSTKVKSIKDSSLWVRIQLL